RRSAASNWMLPRLLRHSAPPAEWRGEGGRGERGPAVETRARGAEAVPGSGALAVGGAAVIDGPPLVGPPCGVEVEARVSRARSALVFFQAEDGIRDRTVTGVQTCALPIHGPHDARGRRQR